MPSGVGPGRSASRPSPRRPRSCRRRLPRGAFPVAVSTRAHLVVAVGRPGEVLDDVEDLAVGRERVVFERPGELDDPRASTAQVRSRMAKRDVCRRGAGGRPILDEDDRPAVVGDPDRRGIERRGSAAARRRRSSGSTPPNSGMDEGPRDRRRCRRSMSVLTSVTPGRHPGRRSGGRRSVRPCLPGSTWRPHRRRCRPTSQAPAVVGLRDRRGRGTRRCGRWRRLGRRTGDVGGALPRAAATANAAAKARIVREVRVGRSCGDMFGTSSVMGGSDPRTPHTPPVVGSFPRASTRRAGSRPPRRARSPADR